MRFQRIILVACSSLLLLSACAGPVTSGPQVSRAELQEEVLRQRSLVLKNFISDQNRLSDIAYPVLTANASVCAARVTPLVGMSLFSLDTVGRDNAAAAQSLFGLTRQLTVQNTVPRGPADRAGIKPGDTLISVSGEMLPDGKAGVTVAARELARAGQGPLPMTLKRGENFFNVIVSPKMGCDFPVLLDYRDHRINAYADGQRIVVSKGILRFAENDNEVAMVVAHELAHSALGHVDKMRNNATVGSIGGLVIDGLLASAGVGTGGQFSQLGGQMALAQYSVPFEQEADYVGMYLLARAGYDTAGVADFWRRMAAEGEASIALRTTHPASAERYLAIDRAHAEISDKKRRGLKLAPNFKAVR
jgi:hypothetical protein